MAKFLVFVLSWFMLSAMADNLVDLNINGNGVSVSIEQISYNGRVSATVIGNGHTMTIDQRGEHTATINLINAGGASNLTLVQNGVIGQAYSITQSCANLAGCSVTVIQGQ